MILVVDANVVVQIVISGGDMGPLRGHELIAPPLMRAEALSSLAEMTYRGEIPAEAGRQAAVRLGDVAIRLDRPPALDERAWDVARSLGWAKTYDAEFLALARIHDASLVTLDERLRRGAGHIVRMPRAAELA